MADDEVSQNNPDTGTSPMADDEVSQNILEIGLSPKGR